MYLLTEDAFGELKAILASGSSKPYAHVCDQIYAWLRTPDERGNEAEGNVLAWFGAAAQTNRGEGGASDFIRTYTAAQLENRQGRQIQNIETGLQDASNAICRIGEESHHLWSNAR